MQLSPAPATESSHIYAHMTLNFYDFPNGWFRIISRKNLIKQRVAHIYCFHGLLIISIKNNKIETFLNDQPLQTIEYSEQIFVYYDRNERMILISEGTRISDCTKIFLNFFLHFFSLPCFEKTWKWVYHNLFKKFSCVGPGVTRETENLYAVYDFL